MKEQKRQKRGGWAVQRQTGLCLFLMAALLISVVGPQKTAKAAVFCGPKDHGRGNRTRHQPDYEHR